MICTKCKQEKPEVEFNFKSKKTGLRQKQCVVCTREMIRRHYQLNRKYYLDKARRWDNAFKAEIRKIILEHFKKNPCLDCGETDSRVLEFDHKSDKILAVSRLIGNKAPKEDILDEIKKCDVRCANCHRRKTAKQFNWFKDI